jgi:hypothetical protein
MSVAGCTVMSWLEDGRTHRATPQRVWRVKVYAGTDRLTGREIQFRKTCKTERAAQIELGKLLAQATAGRQPDSAVTVAQLLDQYVATAGWDVSTREARAWPGPGLSGQRGLEGSRAGTGGGTGGDGVPDAGAPGVRQP